MNRRLRLERLEDRRVLAADFNGDNTVDELDLQRFEFGFGITGTATPGQGDANGDGNVDGSDFLQWQREAGPKQPNLIAYRPQGIHDVTNPMDAPIYDPLPKTPVREVDETDNEAGPGIRVNLDDDNANGIADAQENGIEIERENDLIEVKVERMPGQGALVLTAGSQLSLYYNHDKETPIPVVGGQSEPLPFVNDKVTVFVEWSAFGHGFANLTLVDPATMNAVDSVRFHSFKSLVIIFGGNGQDPQDTDGDGLIGDFIGGGPNREGIFDFAQILYNFGWDVLPFDEEDLDAAEDIPFSEAQNAVANRLVDPFMAGSGLAIMGYSQGGGAAHDLIERLQDEAGITTTVGVYVDAVQYGGLFSETDWPDVAFYMLNIYQTNPGLRGGDIDNSEVIFPAVMEELNVSASGEARFNMLDHFSIDDSEDVWNVMFGGLVANLDR